MPFRDLALWVGVVCVSFSFCWLLGLILGLRSRGVRVPARFWFLHMALCLLVVLGVLLGFLLWTTP